MPGKYGLFTKCHKCGQLFDQIARHWKMSDCEYPKLTNNQKEIVKGSLMGDGHLAKRDKNPHLKLSMINKEYLEYINKTFGVLSCGVKHHKTAKEVAKDKQNRGFDTKKENYSDLYIWYSRSIPEFKEFNFWYKGKNNKTWPKEINITPTLFKHWYVQDGHKKNNSISISLSKEYGNKEKITNYFKDSKFPCPDRHDMLEYKEKHTGKTRKSYNIAWNSRKTEEIFEIIPKPLPGFEYKWLNR